MITCVHRIDTQTDSDTILLTEEAELIKNGQLVAFPTETVYGLGADALDPTAALRIYEAKGRPSDNPLIVHISDISQAEMISASIPETARKLAEAFWPGPLTIILNKNEMVPDETTGGLKTVAVRMPSHPVARALIEQSGCMIAAPSANTSGRPSPTTAQHVYEDMNGKIPMIIDGGSVGIGIESTIVDCTTDVPMILRPGYVTADMVEEICGAVAIDPGIISEDSGIKPKAPGMKYRHYAPKAPLKIVEGDIEKVISYINAQIMASPEEIVGVIATDETKSRYNSEKVFSVGTRADDETVARNLYAVLREMDEVGVTCIFSESFKEQHLGAAIMNRLLKAAGHTVIDV